MKFSSFLIITFAIFYSSFAQENKLKLNFSGYVKSDFFMIQDK